MKVKMTLSIGYSNAGQEEIVEVDDDSTENDLAEDWQNWINNYIDGGWEIIEKGEQKI